MINRTPTYASSKKEAMFSCIEEFGYSYNETKIIMSTLINRPSKTVHKDYPQYGLWRLMWSFIKAGFNVSNPDRVELPHYDDYPVLIDIALYQILQTTLRAK